MIRVRDGEEEHLLTVEEFERRARRGEVSPLAYVCMPALTGDRFVPARELPLFEAIYDPRRIHFRRHFHIGRLPLVTGGLALLCIALFLYSRHLGGGEVSRDALLLLGAKARVRIIEDGELWRLLTANLLHRDLVHLGFNLFALLNIGTVLEGVYRRGDYALLLLISGLSTMGVSVVMSSPVTVGASGLVFGCLGAAVVFGWRYADVLPNRYRTYFGVVVVLYAAIMFYLGLRSASTDNWGHAGGLVAGLLAGTVLEPRLLRLTSHKEPLASLAFPYVASGALVATVFAVGPMLPPILVEEDAYPIPKFGLVLHRPSHWHKVSDPLGFLTFGNGVDAFASLGCARLEGPSRLEEAEARFIERELRGLSVAGTIGDLEVAAGRDDEVGRDPPYPARRIPFSFLASDGPLLADAVVFSRGALECALVLARRPSAPESTQKRLEEIKARLEYVDTDAERQALHRTRREPYAAAAWLDLGIARAEAGHPISARAALSEAERLARTQPEVAVQVGHARARFELNYGGDLEVATRWAESLHALLGDEDLEAALLLLDVRLATDDKVAARQVFDRMNARFPGIPQLTKRRAEVLGVQ